MPLPVMPEFTLIHFLWIASFIGAVAFAFWQDRRDRSAVPDIKPYRWGYFLGMMGLVAGMVIVMTLLPKIPTKQYPVGFTVYVMVLLLGVLTVFPAIIRKRRWGWILVCLFFLLVTRLSLRNGFQVADLSIMAIATLNIIYTIWQWKHIGRKATARLAVIST